jgi:3-oxoacyl-[acyl-carrier-protein] synthase-3
VLTNDELATMVDTTDEWITSRVGIKSRHIAAPDEQVDDMAALAGEKALANAGLTTAEIDMVVVATWTALDRSPNMAAQVARRLGVVERGEIPAGAPVLLFGFGGGLAYAGQIIRCP